MASSSSDPGLDSEDNRKQREAASARASQSSPEIICMLWLAKELSNDRYIAGTVTTTEKGEKGLRLTGTKSSQLQESKLKDICTELKNYVCASKSCMVCG